MNSFGRLFRITTFGESHGPSLGVVIDGCPAGVPIAEEDFEDDIRKRKPGARGTTQREEADRVSILSGVFNRRSSGAAITLLFRNENVRSRDYEPVRHTPRPGHADFVAFKKYGGYNDYRGGGAFSGRLTLALVAAGVIAKKIIRPIEIAASIDEAGGDTDIAAAVERAQRDCDSIGGIIACSARNMPVGLGEPFFDSAESLLGHMMFSIPAVKAIEFGAGFTAARMRGSEHNDPIISETGATATNNAGGINGGITNGNDLRFRVAVKPTSSIQKKQSTIDLRSGEKTELVIDGRHDTCIALRTPVVIEAATAIVLADLLLQAQKIGRVIR